MPRGVGINNQAGWLQQLRNICYAIRIKLSERLAMHKLLKVLEAAAYIAVIVVAGYFLVFVVASSIYHISHDVQPTQHQTTKGCQ